MTRRRMSCAMTLDPKLVAEVDKAAESAGLNRSRYVEKVLRAAQGLPVAALDLGQLADNLEATARVLRAGGQA